MDDCESRPLPGIYLRGGRWHISFTRNGRRIRKATGQRDYASAKAVYLREMSDQVDRTLTETWAASVASGKEPGQWLRSLFNSSIRRARDSGRPHSVSLDQVATLALDSGGKCALTGIVFELPHPDRRVRLAFAPSLDRIDSQKGYTPQNCRLVCASVNYAMNVWGDAVLERIAMAFLLRKIQSPLNIGHNPGQLNSGTPEERMQLIDLVDSTGIEPVTPAV